MAPTTNPNQFQYGAGLEGPDANFKNTAEWLPYLIQSQLGGLASTGVNNLQGAQGTYDASRLRALNALSPGGAHGLLQAFLQMMSGQSADLGRKNAATLRAGGVTGADSAAQLDANNQGALAGTKYANELFNPEGVAGRAQQSMQLSSPEAVFPLLRTLLQLDSAVQGKVGANNAMHAQSAGGGLGGIVGSLLGLIPGLGGASSLLGGSGPQAAGEASDSALQGILAALSGAGGSSLWGGGSSIPVRY